VFSYENNWIENQPQSVVITTNPHNKNEEFAQSISLMTYMDLSRLKSGSKPLIRLETKTTADPITNNLKMKL